MTHSILLNHHPLNFLHPVHKALDRMQAQKFLTQRRGESITWDTLIKLDNRKLSTVIP